MNLSFRRLWSYLRLVRAERPIGFLLLVWPALWSLWLASGGPPSLRLLFIFIAGAWLMRSAGCAINDYADRDIDVRVARTRARPLAAREIVPAEALTIATLLVCVAFVLVLLTNILTIALAAGGALLAAIYPFTKRFMRAPQLVLACAFACSVPMAFAAVRGELHVEIWWVFAAAFVWTVVYDTFYAMTDREDDLKIGVNSTAILFGSADRVVCAILQALTLSLLVMLGLVFGLGLVYYCGLGLVALLFIDQQLLIRTRQPNNCFRAFLRNNYVGMTVFVAIAADYAVAIGSLS